jgi:4-hydroxy-3-polyprenylbenzoate decarboxylase
VIVVDAGVDVHDYAAVTWQAGANVDPARDVELGSGPLDQLDHAPQIQSFGGKIGIDATAKWESEGYSRGWPGIARMNDEVRQRVDARWAELGIPVAAPSAGPGAAPAAGRRRLLRRPGR